MLSLFRTFSVLFIISIAVRIVDVIKSLIIASKLGVSDQADVFLSLSTLPDSLLIIFGLDSLKGVVNSEYSSEDSGASAKISESLSNLFGILLLLGLSITLILFFFRVQLINLLLPGFNDDRFTLALSLSVMILPVFFIKPVSALLFAYYNSIKRFYFPIILQVSVSLFIIIFIYFPVFGNQIVFNISFGFLIGNFFYFLVLLMPQLINKNLKPRLNIKPDKLSLKIIKNCFVLFLVVVINQVYLFTRNFLVSFFDGGSISALNYGTSLPTFVSSLTFTVVFGVLLNNLSKLHSSNSIAEANKLLSDTINSITFIYVPLVVILFVFNINILSIVYLRGNFDMNGILLTSPPFIWETLSLIPFVFFIMPVALYLGFKDYKRYSKVGVLVYASGILINIICVKLFGFFGVSVGSFFVYSILAIFLIYFSKSLIGNLMTSLKDSFKLLLIGIVITIPMIFVRDNLLKKVFSSDISTVLAGSVIVISVYMFLSFALNINYLYKVKHLIRN